jgi:hypothetical protein
MANALKAAWDWTAQWEFELGETFMSSWKAPVCGMVGYLTVIFGLRYIMSKRATPISAALLRPFLVLHNLLLCSYSAMSVLMVVFEIFRYQVCVVDDCVARTGLVGE